MTFSVHGWPCLGLGRGCSKQREQKWCSLMGSQSRLGSRDRRYGLCPPGVPSSGGQKLKQIKIQGRSCEDAQTWRSQAQHCHCMGDNRSGWRQRNVEDPGFLARMVPFTQPLLTLPLCTP